MMTLGRILENRGAAATLLGPSEQGAQLRKKPADLGAGGPVFITASAGGHGFLWCAV